jgi:hypothetical protein
MNIPGVFLNTVVDLQELPEFLKAADNFEQCSSEDEMCRVYEWMQMQTLFNKNRTLYSIGFDTL